MGGSDIIYIGLGTGREGSDVYLTYGVGHKGREGIVILSNRQDIVGTVSMYISSMGRG